MTPHNNVIALQGDESYTAAGVAIAAQSLDAPLNSTELAAFLTGLTGPPRSCRGGRGAFIGQWFGAANSLPDTVTGLSAVTGTGTEADVIKAPRRSRGDRRHRR